MALDNFDRLEEGLTRLLAAYETLASEKDGSSEALAAKDREIAELKTKLKKLEAERDGIREKVDVLLEKLEGLIQGA
ncbi:MAG TPA: cell division protein ZapB [Thermodesulfobacteriota bacterium]